jgi:hypothetical protein
VSRKRRFIVFLLAGLAVALLLSLLGLYLAARHEPAFYCAAMSLDPTALEKGSDRMLQHIAALQSAGNRPGRWQTVITAEEINGWLAVDLPRNHPSALPPSLGDPRVAISPDEMILACRYDAGGVRSVLSLTVQPYLAQPNVVALRIVRARAGLLPMPLKTVLDGLSGAAHAMQSRLTWADADGMPVALLSMPDDMDADRTVRIEALELLDGAVRITVATRQR